MQRLVARYVWTSPWRCLSPGEVVLDSHGRVAAVRAVRSRRVPDRALLPGLVNAHAHLQLSALGHKPDGFQAWLRAVIAVGSGGTPELARAHLEELLASGCTAIGDVDSTGQLPEVLRQLPFAGRCYREALGLDVSAAEARRMLARPPRGTRACPAGRNFHSARRSLLLTKWHGRGLKKPSGS